MSMFESIILGLVQGLAEFLPVSSSAHLILTPWLMGWSDPGLTFDLALHLGTVVALLVYFRKEWVQLTVNTLRWITAKDKSDPVLRLGPLIILGTIPGAIIGLLLEKKAEEAFRSPLLIACTLSTMGIVLWLADKRGKKTNGLERLGVKEVLLIGIGQGLAVIPGFSRSGTTISVGLTLGLTRESAARFSFMLGLPITLGACFLKLRHLHISDLTPEFLAGVVVSAVVGLFAIGVLLKFLRTNSYGIFAAYRVLVALVIVALIISGIRGA